MALAQSPSLILPRPLCTTQTFFNFVFPWLAFQLSSVFQFALCSDSCWFILFTDTASFLPQQPWLGLLCCFCTQFYLRTSVHLSISSQPWVHPIAGFRLSPFQIIPKGISHSLSFACIPGPYFLSADRTSPVKSLSISWTTPWLKCWCRLLPLDNFE